MMRKLSLLSGLFIFLWALPAYSADVADNLQNEIATQAETFREEAGRAPEKITEKPEIGLEKKKEETPSADTGPRFKINRVELTGNTIFKDITLEKLIRELKIGMVSFEKLRQGAQAITDYYRAKGYVTSRAYLPPQTVENEQVEMKIVEGKIGKIFVEGNKVFASSIYEKSIRLRADRIFRYQDLEDSLYFLNRQPDRSAKAYLIAGEDATTSDIILKVSEKRPYHAFYNFSNRGTKSTHRGRHSGHVIHNNLTGRADVLHASFSMAEEGAFKAGSGSYTLSNEITNTDFNLTATLVNSLLIGTLAPLEIKGESWSLTPTLTQTFIESPKFTFQVFGSLEFKDSKTLVNDFKSSYDRMRVLVAGPRLSWNDTLGRASFTGAVHQGLPNFLGGLSESDVQASRPNSGGDFTAYTASLSRLQRLPKGFYLVARGNGQWTAESLTSLEQFRLGGAHSVRGYPEGDSGGDYGWGFSLEVGTPARFIPKHLKVPFTKKKWRDALRIVGFLDGGKSYLRQRSATTQQKDRFLLGAGFGVRLELDEYVSMQADLAFPIGDDSTDEKDQMQAHVSMRAGF